MGVSGSVGPANTGTATHLIGSPTFNAMMPWWFARQMPWPSGQSRACSRRHAAEGMHPWSTRTTPTSGTSQRCREWFWSTFSLCCHGGDRSGLPWSTSRPRCTQSWISRPAMVTTRTPSGSEIRKTTRSTLGPFAWSFYGGSPRLLDPVLQLQDATAVDLNGEVPRDDGHSPRGTASQMVSSTRLPHWV